MHAARTGVAGDEDMRPLNLGCGGVVPRGWISVDRGDQGQEYVLDMRAGLPFDHNSAPYAVAHHLIDMFDPRELADFLLEVGRVLEPGGVLRISVADMRGAIDAAERGDDAWFHMLDKPAWSLQEKLDFYLTWGGARLSFLTVPLIERALRDAGFEVGSSVGWTCYHSSAICELDSRLSESVIVEGIA